MHRYLIALIALLPLANSARLHAMPAPCGLIPLNNKITFWGHSRMFSLAVHENAYHSLTGATKAPYYFRWAKDSDKNFILDQDQFPSTAEQPTIVQDLSSAGSRAVDSPASFLLTEWFLAPFDKIRQAGENIWLWTTALARTHGYEHAFSYLSQAYLMAEVLPFRPESNNVNSRNVDTCHTRGLPYRSTDKNILMLGGNDLIAFYETMQKYEGQYFITRLLLDPTFLWDYIFNRSRVNAELEIFWTWNYNALTDRVAHGVENLAHYILEVQFNTFGHKGNGYNALILFSDPPIIDWGGGLSGDDNFWRRNIRYALYFRMMRDKLQFHTLPRLAGRFPGRVFFWDMYYPFIANILQQGASYYHPGVSDGVHFFGGEGAKEFGRQVAYATIAYGWFRPSSTFSFASISKGYLFEEGPFELQTCVVPGGCSRRMFEGWNIQLEANGGTSCPNPQNPLAPKYNWEPQTISCTVWGCWKIDENGVVTGPPTWCANTIFSNHCHWYADVTVEDCSDPPVKITRRLHFSSGL